MESLLVIILVLVVVGVLMWGVNKFLPIEQPWKNIINFVALVVTLIWVVARFI